MANKKITDLQLIAAVTDTLSIPGDNGIQTYRATAAQLKTYINPMPIGALVPYAGASAPSGFLLCAGQAVSRTTYADLFDIIGTTYGSGDGSTTFNVPDLRGRGAVGKDDMGGSAASRVTTAGSGVDGATLGAVGGAQNHTLTTAQMPSHTHTQNAHTHVQTAHYHTVSSVAVASGDHFHNNTSTNKYIATIDEDEWTGSVFSTIAATDTTSALNQTETATNQNTGGDGAHNNMQPSIIMNYLIKY